MFDLREGNARFVSHPAPTLVEAVWVDGGVSIVASDAFLRQAAHALKFARETGREQFFTVLDRQDVTRVLGCTLEHDDDAGARLSFRSMPAGLSEASEVALLRRALDATSDAVMITEGEHQDGGAPRIVYVNAAFSRMTGYTSDEVIGKSPRLLQGPSTLASTRAEIRASLQHWRPIRAELLNYRKDGSEFWVELDLAPVADESGWYTHWIGLQRDTTDRRNREYESLVASRVESLGILAGGIAHDFNNALSIILAHSSLVELQLRPPASPERVSKARAAAKEITAAVDYAASLTKQLLGFAKGGSATPAPMDLSALTKKMVELILRGSNVRARFENVPDAWVYGDSGQLGQVIVNLALNAREAMPAGGELLVQVDHANASGSMAPGRYVKLTMRDQGKGIPEAIRARIFEPYFTTKGSSGLGLAVAQAAIRKHSGYIEVESQIDVFTAFSIYLPESKAPQNAEFAETSRVISGAGCVLVLDDGRLLRESVASLLAELGYRAQSVASGEDAVAQFELARKRGAPFDMALLDVTIPGEAGGVDVARRLREKDAGLLILLMSGYSDQIAHVTEQPHAVDGFVEKPFGLEALSLAIGKASSARARSRA